MKHLRPLPILLHFLLLAAMAHAQGRIAGIVTTLSERMPLCTVQLWRDSTLVQQCLTNMDGEYAFEGLEAGKYVVEARVDEWSAVSDVILSSSRTHLVGLLLEPPSDQPGYWTIVPNCNDCHGIDRYPHEAKAFWLRLHTRRLIDFAVRTTDILQLDQGDPLHFRGSRSECNLTFIDGRKVRGSDELPLMIIQDIQVLTGGLPAEYGDATGAVMLVTTRGPSYVYRSRLPQQLKRKKAPRES